MSRFFVGWKREYIVVLFKRVWWFKFIVVTIIMFNTCGCDLIECYYSFGIGKIFLSVILFYFVFL